MIDRTVRLLFESDEEFILYTGLFLSIRYVGDKGSFFFSKHRKIDKMD